MKATAATAIILKLSGRFYVMITFRHRMNRRMKKICWEPQIRVTRPHRFEFSDSVTEALRSPAALEADEEEDRLLDSLLSLQVEAGVANVIETHLGK